MQGCPECIMRVATGRRKESNLVWTKFSPLILSYCSGGEGKKLLTEFYTTTENY